MELNEPIEINIESMSTTNLFDDSIVNYFLSGDIGGGDLQQQDHHQHQQQQQCQNSFMVDDSSCGVVNQVVDQQQLEQFYQQQVGQVDPTLQMMDMNGGATSATPLSSHSSPIDYTSSSSPAISYPSSPSMVVPNHSSPFDASPSSSMSSPEHHQQYNNNMMAMMPTTSTINGYDEQHTAISFVDPKAVSNEANNVPVYEEPAIDIDEKLKTIFDRKNIHSQTIAAPQYHQNDLDDDSSSSDDSRKKNNKRPNDQTRVQNLVQPLTRDELFKISGKEAVHIEPQSTSTPEEERIVKKQRRLIKNRESAQLSRMRKKIFIEDLEKKIGDLTTENNNLREEVLYLQGIIKQFAHASPSLLSEVQQAQPQPQQQQQIQQHHHNHQQPQYQLRHKNVKAAGVCLLIIIFSIGIFLNPQPSQPSFSIAPSSSIPRTTRDITALEQPHLLDTSATTSSAAIVPTQDDSSLYISPSSPLSPPSSSPLHLSPPPSHIIEDDNTNSLVLSKKRPVESTPVHSTEQQQQQLHHRKRIRILSADDDDDDNIIDNNNSLVYDPLHNHQVVAELSSPSSVNGFFETPQQHSSYIVCSDAPRIISQNITQTTESIFNSNSSSPLSIGLLLPAESLGLNVSDERTILEISCLVSNIRVWNPTAATAAVSSQIQSADSVDIHHHHSQQPQQLIIHSP